jgi:MGT family glycosyltransferase
LALALRFFTSGLKQQTRQIAGYAQTWNADVVVGDYLLPAAMLGAQLSNRPYVALYHSALPFPVQDAPPFGSGLEGVSADSEAWRRAEERVQGFSDFFDKTVAGAAKSLGTPFKRASLLTSPMSEELNLLTTIPELEPGLLPLQGPVVMTGPCLPRVESADDDDPALQIPRDGKRRVYVSLGTVFNDQPHIFRSILEGISGLGLQVIVSAGASYDRFGGQPDADVHVFRRVPQVALLPTVDVVITHGGNNTVQETLVAGKPMVVVPFGGEQIVNARRVQQLGAGTTVLPGELDAASIRRAVETALQPAIVERARTLGDALRAYDGTAIAAGKILELAVGDTAPSNDAGA